MAPGARMARKIVKRSTWKKKLSCLSHVRDICVKGPVQCFQCRL